MRNPLITWCVLAASLLFGDVLHAEEVFYRTDTRVQSVDCHRGHLQANNRIYLVRILPSKVPAQRTHDMCAALQAAADLQRSITLLTANRNPKAEPILEEVVGVVDLDYMRGVMDLEFDPTFVDACAVTSRSTETCFWVSRYSKKVFVEMKMLGRPNTLLPAQVTRDGEKNLTLTAHELEHEHRFLIPASGTTVQREYDGRVFRPAVELSRPFDLDRER